MKLRRIVPIAVLGFSLVFSPYVSLAGDGSTSTGGGTSSPTTWSRIRSWAGRPEVRDGALVVGALAGGAAGVIFLPAITSLVGVTAFGASLIAGTAFVAKAAVGAAVGATVLTRVRAAVAGKEDRARSSLGRDALLVSATTFGAFAAVPLLPSVGPFAGAGVLGKLAVGGLGGASLVKGTEALVSRPEVPARLERRPPSLDEVSPTVSLQTIGRSLPHPRPKAVVLPARKVETAASSQPRPEASSPAPTRLSALPPSTSRDPEPGFDGLNMAY